MHWIAPSEKDTRQITLENRLGDSADQFRANAGLKGQECLASVLRLTPYKGRIYDPACDSGGELGDISIYGQKSNATTRRLAVMHLALHGIEANLVNCMVALPDQLFYSTQIPVTRPTFSLN